MGDPPTPSIRPIVKQELDVVAYIPARLGSERVRRKNLRSLAGRPLIGHVVETALRSTVLDRIYVNTESQEIAEAASAMGAAVYLRKESLAESSVRTDEILYDFAKAVSCQSIFVINPTAPFLKTSTIDLVRATLLDKGADTTVFTTTRLYRHLILDGLPRNFDPSAKSPRTQDLKPFEYINFIAFAIARSKVLSEYERRGHCLYVPPLAFVPMAGIECHDIDDEDDFVIAEGVMARKERRADANSRSTRDAPAPRAGGGRRGMLR